MAKFSAFLLGPTMEWGTQRIFLIKKEEGATQAIEIEQLRQLRAKLIEKYGYDLAPIDMEVAEVTTLEAQIKKAIPKRKRS